MGDGERDERDSADVCSTEPMDPGWIWTVKEMEGISTRRHIGRTVLRALPGDRGRSGVRGSTHLAPVNHQLVPGIPAERNRPITDSFHPMIEISRLNWQSPAGDGGEASGDGGEASGAGSWLVERVGY